MRLVVFHYILQEQYSHLTDVPAIVPKSTSSALHVEVQDRHDLYCHREKTSIGYETLTLYAKVHMSLINFTECFHMIVTVREPIFSCHSTKYTIQKKARNTMFY